MGKRKESTLSAPMLRLIEALAKQDAADLIAEQTQGNERSNSGVVVSEKVGKKMLSAEREPTRKPPKKPRK